MAILITDNNNQTKRIEETSFRYEDKLQEYVAKNPEIIPVYDIDEDTKLLVVAREFSTISGPIDALGFDNKGNIYIIETKLYKNPEGRRSVIAQALDYGASLWKSSNDFSDFLAQLDVHCKKIFSQTFEEKYTEFCGVDDISENLQQIEENLNGGIIKFVVLVDKLHEQVKNLAMFVNQNSKFDLYLVEVEYYKHEKFEIIIPKLYGSEVKKEVATKTVGQRRKWSEQEFIDKVGELNADNRQAISKLIDWAKENADSISYGTGVITGSMNPKFNHISPRSFTHILTSGEVQISYGYLEPNIELMKKLRDTLVKYISFPKITNISNEKLPRSEWLTMPADYVSKNVDQIIEAFNEFTRKDNDA